MARRHGPGGIRSGGAVRQHGLGPQPESPGGCPNDCSLLLQVEATQAVAPGAEKGRDNLENQRKNATISKP